MDRSAKAKKATPAGAAASHTSRSKGGHRGPPGQGGMPSGLGSGANSLQALTQRVEALEAAVEQLQECTVQQWPDGRLHLPASHVLRIEFGNTRLVMDFRTFMVEVNGQVILGPPAMQQQTSTSSSGSVQDSAGQSAPGSWRDIAQQGGIASPRRLPGGQRIGF